MTLDDIDFETLTADLKKAKNNQIVDCFRRHKVPAELRHKICEILKELGEETDALKFYHSLMKSSIVF